MVEHGYRIRLAVKEDCAQILSLVKALVDEIQIKAGMNMTVAQMKEDGFPRDGPPAFTCHVTERRDAPGALVGICLHYLTYSAHAGRTVYLEDLYIAPSCRGRGLGTRLLSAMAEWAQRRGICRINYSIAYANVRLRQFHQGLGAVNLTGDEGWHMHRISGAALHRLAGMNQGDNGAAGQPDGSPGAE